MQVKFLKSVVEHLINKQAVPIVDLLVGKKDVNEFLIAKKLELTINQARNILYKLSDYGLVSFIRKKDKRKGWYIYFWTLNIYQSLKLLDKKLREELKQTQEQLKSRKEKRYYICNICSIEVTEEGALLNDFICPECEEVYELSDHQEIIQSLEKNFNKLKKEIQLVQVELEKEGEKVEKKKAKKIKIAEEERKAKRKRNRKISAKLKESLKKKSKKKVVKKKAKKKVVKKKPKNKVNKKEKKKVMKKKKQVKKKKK
jgi:transcription factor E